MKTTFLILISLFFLQTALSESILNIEKQAAALYQKGKYTEAEKLYKKLAESAVSGGKYNLQLASLYKEKGDYAKALYYLEKFRKETQSSSSENEKNEITLFECTLLYLKGDILKAHRKLTELSRHYKDYRVWLYNGLVYEELKNTPAAARCYGKSLQIQENVIALYRLGKILFREKKYSEAAEMFLRLVKLDASFRIGYYYLGRCYLKSGNLVEAYRYLSRAKNLYPYNLYLRKEVKNVSKKLGEKFFLKQRKELAQKREKAALPVYKPITGKIPLVKVGIIRKARSLTFKSSGRITVTSPSKQYILNKNRFYTIFLKGRNLYLKDYKTGKGLLTLNAPLNLYTNHTPFYILGVKYGDNQYWESRVDNAYRGNIRIIVNDNALNIINVVNMEEYLYGVLPSEIYPSAGMEALKAQAVAARTIAFRNLGRHSKEGFDFCSDTHCQVYRGISAERKKTNMAVDATRGEIMAAGGEPITAFYHSNCGGCLRNDLFDTLSFTPFIIDVRGEKTPLFSPWEAEVWFKTKPDTFCSHTPRPSNFRWQRMYDTEDFLLAFSFPLKSLERIDILKKGKCEHIDAVRIVKGDSEKIIERDINIRRYFDGLRSSAFKIEVAYRKKRGRLIPEKIFFWGAGFGHSTGMCQEGAEEMAEEGYTYTEILHHYYRNISIKKMY